jgi:hypothetical protein
MAVKYLTDKNDDGSVIGQDATEKVAFWGATPVVQQTYTATAVTAIGTTTISQVATSGKWAFATSTAAAALVTRVDQVQVDVAAILSKLNTLGLVDAT